MSIAFGLSVCLCVSVCLRAYLWNHQTDLYAFFVRIPCGHGSVLLWRHCNTLCTSSFMEMSPSTIVGHMAMHAKLGWSLISMNALLILY